MKKNGFVKGAIILVVCNLIAKVIGAIYRVPLANLLGPVGVGKYQLVFPLYSLLLSISVSGIPIAISKIVAEYNSKKQFGDIKKLLKLAKLYLVIISVVVVVFIVFTAKFIAKIQGNSEIYFCYYAIAPAVLFVGILSVYRGYFQGNLNMLPTALSNIVEQIGKFVFSLLLAKLFSSNGVVWAVFGALIGISISELIALIFLMIYYFFGRKKVKEARSILASKTISRQLVLTALPITLGGIASPITAIIDSLLVVNLLIFTGFGSNEATALLGLQSGIVDPLINIPIVLAVSISASLLPNLSKVYAEKNENEVKLLIEKSMQLTLSVSLVCAICFVIFGRQILAFLYGSSLSFNQLLISTKLLFLGGVNLIFLSLLQVSSGVLQGIGKQVFTMKSIIVGCVIKIVLTCALVAVPQINILGAMISGGISYIVVFFMNYYQIRKLTHARISKVFFDVIVQECLVCLFAYFTNKLFSLAFGEFVALFAAGFVSIIIFGVTYYTFFLIEKESVVSS